MASKYFEVRDVATFVPVIAFRTSPKDYLARRAGFSNFREQTIVLRLTDLKAAYDGDEGQFIGRTMAHAINYIHNHWDELENEAVIDVEFILGETKEPKKSERFR